MTINSYAVVANGIVENIVIWDGESEWSPPVGTTAVPVSATEIVNIGYLFDGTNFTEPTSTQQESQPQSGAPAA